MKIVKKKACCFPSYFSNTIKLSHKPKWKNSDEVWLFEISFSFSITRAKNEKFNGFKNENLKKGLVKEQNPWWCSPKLEKMCKNCCLLLIEDQNHFHNLRTTLPFFQLNLLSKFDALLHTMRKSAKKLNSIIINFMNSSSMGWNLSKLGFSAWSRTYWDRCVGIKQKTLRQQIMVNLQPTFIEYVNKSRFI